MTTFFSADDRIYITVICVAAAAVIFIMLLRRLRRQEPVSVDDLEGHDFEYYCADLLEKSGFQNVQVTKGSGDFGADILCERSGITYAVQCKCYDSDVGVHAVQEVYAGKDYYDRMVAAVMTNQYFTGPAKQMAEKLNVMLWDRDYLGMLSSGYC
jgi:restriction system protein